MEFNLRYLHQVCTENESTIEFCAFSKILTNKEPKICVDYEAEGKLLCQKRDKNKSLPYILECKNCNKETSITINIWFLNSKETALQILLMVYFLFLGLTIKYAAFECSVNVNTVCGENCFIWLSKM